MTKNGNSAILNAFGYLINSNLVSLERCHLSRYTGKNRVLISLTVYFLEQKESVQRNRERKIIFLGIG